jgi:hypothetical protein
LLEEALALHRETNDRQCEITALTLIASSAMERGEVRPAAGLYAESLSLSQAIGDRTTIASTALLERIAALAVASAQMGHAARLLGASESLREQLGTPLLPYHRTILERCLHQVSSRLAPTVLDTTIAEGRALPLADAVHQALAVCERARADVGLIPTAIRDRDILLATSRHHTSP